MKNIRRGLKILKRDPDNTAAVFDIVNAVPGDGVKRALKRFRRTDGGRRILSERRDLLTTLDDRDYLASLPEGSLGRAYCDFTSREQLMAAGLVAASNVPDAPAGDSPDLALFRARIRDMHDLWHVVTGYQRDVLGESAMLAFLFAQIHELGIGLIAASAYYDADGPGRRLIYGAWRRGRRAAWLPAADWEGLLPRPLDDVRADLRLGEPPAYEPVFSRGAPAATA